MNDFPDFSSHSYQIKKELGHNRAGGRVTYLATHIKTQQQVVIKQFQFAKVGASWSSFDTYEREIALLKELNHPGIPRYLDSFQTLDGFCMVQEYKEAVSLAVSRSFDPNEICRIAIAALEILVYLQNRIPPIIHRDLKPENVLLDQQGNVYLVDFGFARVGEGEVGVSSVVKGTLGFMPPEQLFNRQLTEASDLYGLGMTLICLLTGTKSDNIGDLVDISYRVSFKHLIPKLNQHWVNWLEKMVEPRVKDRFPNALAALDAIPLTPLRPPEAQFSQSSLELRARHAGEVLTQQITILNPVPDTVLEGNWEIAPHPHDPVRGLYHWVSVEPVTFVGNEMHCQVAVDTRQLMSGKTYHRRLLLHANTLAKTYSLSLQIQTAHSSQRSHSLPYGLVALLVLFFTGLGWLTSWFVVIMGIVAGSIASASIGTLVGSAIGLEGATWLMRSAGWRLTGNSSTLPAVIVGATVLAQVFSGSIVHVVEIAVLLGAGLGVLSGVTSGVAMNIAVEKMLIHGSQRLFAIALTVLVATLGLSLGVGLNIGFSPRFVAMPFSISTVLFVILLAKTQLQQMNTVFSTKKAERYFIKP